MNAHPPLRSFPAAPALLVGVTGLMDLDSDPELVELFRCVLRFLRHGPGYRLTAGQPRMLDVLLTELAPPGPADETARLREVYEQALSRWLPLAHTPIVVMCGLAPGADTLAAEILLQEPEFSEENGFYLRAPLPFPAAPEDLYGEASTFVRTKDGQPDPGNEARRAKYRELVQQLGEANTFLVNIAADGGRPLAELLPELRRDLSPDQPQRRRERYYAAGEFLAAYCHLLIALFDGRRGESSAGTGAVVAARLAGARWDILPGTRQFPMPHGGPVLHMFADRQARPSGQPDWLPNLRLLHPLTYSPPGAHAEHDPAPAHPASPGEQILGAGQESNASLQRDRLGLFCRQAGDLEIYNALSPAAWSAARLASETEKLLQCHDEQGRELPPVSLPRAADGSAGAYERGVQRLAMARSQASAASRSANEAVGRGRQALFQLTLLGVILLHLFCHWHPQEPKQEEKPGELAAIRTVSLVREAPVGEPAEHEEHLSGVRVAFGGLAIAVVIAALLRYALLSSRQIEERGHDARALGEGLRVQIFWNLAGLGKSVSANYMQRQRGELDWIRAAVRSVAFPYSQWSEHFAKLAVPVKLGLLRCVRDQWVQEQHKYFNLSYRKYGHRLHLWHGLGAVLALTGLDTLLAPFVASWHPSLAHELAVARVWWWLAAGVLLGAAALRVLLHRHGEHAHGTHFYDPWRETAALFRPPAAAAQSSAWRDWLAYLARLPLALLRVAMEVIHWMVHLEDVTRGGPLPFGQRLRHSLQSFAIYLPLSIAGAIAGLLICAELSHLPGFPKADDLWIIIGGVELAAGALAVAWAEKNLYSELAYQYNTMAGLFDAALVRLNQELSQLDALLRAGDEPQAARKIEQIQGLLFDLGQEALDENAEWLLLHRARPLEPVMAG